MNVELLSIQNISYSATAGEKNKFPHILKNISFNIFEGEILGISGESGGGKTTLGKIISGLLLPSEGKIVWNPKFKLNKPRTSPVQILFQNNGEILNPIRRINSVLNDAVMITLQDRKFAEKQTNYLFDSVGIEPRLRNRKGYELSGGEQQRVALARLLAVNPKLLILDEPFSAQDVESQLNLAKLCKKINKEFNVTILCISHDLNILRKLSNRVLIMKEGKVLELGETQKVFSNPAHPFTKFLLKAENYSLDLNDLHPTKKL
ncbi:MAG TPA: ATP-binding cassette domain-containing protein [Ignavibacteriaceae bacterium]|jgi:ABC-type dipeptide/oligopeptide/nickel transport system ATPase subunit